MTTKSASSFLKYKRALTVLTKTQETKFDNVFFVKVTHSVKCFLSYVTKAEQLNYTSLLLQRVIIIIVYCLDAHKLLYCIRTPRKIVDQTD